MPEAYRAVSDEQRGDFLQSYMKNGLKNLQWLGSYTQKLTRAETEEDQTQKGMMTMLPGGTSCCGGLGARVRADVDASTMLRSGIASSS